VANGNGAGCFDVEEWAVDTTNVKVAGLGKCSCLDDEAEIASRVGGAERAVVSWLVDV